MRKQTKIAAVVSAAALLALGASITSFAAAKGTWMMTDGEWYCYDKNGDVYTNTFCSYNGKEFYVGDDGALVTSSWVDYDGSKYFVKGDGSKVINDWRLTTPMDDENGEEQWFYFQSTGKMAENKKVLYKGKTYYFNADGQMLTGWVTANSNEVLNEESTIDADHTFYCDETGARVENNWVYTTAPTTADNDVDAEEYWYFLKATTGKVATGKVNNIKGQSYVLGNTDANRGQLLTGWVAAQKNGTKLDYIKIDKDTDNYKVSDKSFKAVYYAPYGDDFDGHVKKNQWIKAWRPADAYEEDEDVSKKYYWLGKDGVVFVPETAIAAGYKFVLGDGALKLDSETQFDISKKKIGSKDYFFNNDGEMLSGFIKVVALGEENKGTLKEGMYYLGGGADGSMKSGAQNIKDENGDTFKFFFDTASGNKGVGVTGNKSGKLYFEGHLVAASDYKYQVVTVDMDRKGTKATFIVNQNGSIQSSVAEYKEDGEILIDAKKNSASFNTSATNSLYKNSVKDATKLINNIPELDPTVIMPVRGADSAYSSSAIKFTPADGYKAK